MPFGIQIDPLIGKAICHCCRDMLWHCEKCWRQHHNSQGLIDDFEPPKYYGQSMMSEEIIKKMDEKYEIKHNPSIKADKNRIYKEGEYH